MILVEVCLTLLIGFGGVPVETIQVRTNSFWRFFSQELVLKIQEFLLDSIPEWADFQVVGAGTYLGFGVGPLAGDIM